MRTAVVVLALAAIGCGKSDSSSPPAKQGQLAVGELGGTVLELDGKVTSRQGNVVAALAVGNHVAADALIETGPDGRVVIELVNHARWELGANKRQRVRDSIAWKVPAGSGNANVIIHDNADLDGSAAASSTAQLTAALAPKKAELVACLGDAPKVVLLLDTGPGGLAGFRVKGGTRSIADCMMGVLQKTAMPHISAHAAVPIEK